MMTEYKEEDEDKMKELVSCGEPDTGHTTITQPSQSRNHVVMSKNAKLITSAIIWYCTFTLGLSMSFLGASLIEFSIKFNVEVSTISKIFSVLTASFLLGAMLWGVVFNYVNRQLACVFCLCVMGISTICLPWMPSLVLFFGIAALGGFTTGGYDTAQIVWIIEMWENQAAPYIQTQHFSFAVGALVSPLIMRPFLSDNTEQPNNAEHVNYELQSNYSINAGGPKQPQKNDTLLYFTESPQDVTPNPVLYVPFLIGGLAYILGGVLLLVMYVAKKYVKPPKDSSTSTDQDSSNTKLKRGMSKSCNTTRIFLVLFSALILASYSGMEVCTIQFLPTFTRFIELGLSGPEGALILSGLTGAFTLGRGIGILIVFKILPELLLLFNIITIIIGNSILYFFANDSYIALCIGSITLGIGFSTVFPSYYGFIEKHLKVSNVVGAIMIVGGGAISSVYPIIIGEYIKSNPFVLMYTNYFSVCACIACFVGIYFITSRNEGECSDNGRDISQEGEGLNLNARQNGAQVPLHQQTSVATKDL